MMGVCGVFSELDTSVAGTVLFGDGSVVKIEGRGMIPVIQKNGCRSTLTGVYFIPRLMTNILSVGQLDEVSCRVAIEEGVLRIWNRKKELVVMIQRMVNRLYKLQLNILRQVCLAVHDERSWRWHARYGHIGWEALWMLGRRQMVRGMPALNAVERICDAASASFR